VYRYASCDRSFLFSPHASATERRIRDRYTGEVVAMGDQAYRDFLELTFANEFDLISVSPDFAAANGKAIAKALHPFRELVSAAAQEAFLAPTVTLKQRPRPC